MSGRVNGLLWSENLMDVGLLNHISLSLLGISLCRGGVGGFVGVASWSVARRPSISLQRSARDANSQQSEVEWTRRRRNGEAKVVS
jgi:hypothetical protein